MEEKLPQNAAAGKGCRNHVPQLGVHRGKELGKRLAGLHGCLHPVGGLHGHAQGWKEEDEMEGTSAGWTQSI